MKKNKEKNIDIEQKSSQDRDLEDELLKGIKDQKKNNISKMPISNKVVLKALQQGEDGDAYLLIKLLKDRYVFDHTACEWYYWNEHFWRLDKINHIVTLIKEVINLYGEQKIFESFALKKATKNGDESDISKHEYFIKLLNERIKSLRTLKRKKTILQLAASGLGSLGVTGEDWDKNPMLLACRNGVVDLKKGMFTSGKPKDYIKTASQVKWVKHDSPCPAWEKFLLEMLDNNQEVVDYIQRLLGYGITGLNTEHIFPIFWGQDGRNGKGTLFETLKFILGDFAYKAPSNFLIEQKIKGSGAAPDAVKGGLLGKRIVWCSENNENDRLDVAKLKELSGGDTVTARLPYARRQLEFMPMYLFLTITNRRPRVPPNDKALWQRIHLIPLVNSFIDVPDPKNKHEFKADKKLLSKLRKESSGILAWFVRGCMLWQKLDLSPPESISRATNEYRAHEDIIGDFILESCHVDDNDNLRVERKKLYESYKRWCEEVGHHSMSKKRFFDNIKDKFDSKKSDGIRYFIGIGLI